MPAGPSKPRSLPLGGRVCPPRWEETGPTLRSRNGAGSPAQRDPHLRRAPPHSPSFKGKLPLAGTGFLLPAPFTIKTERITMGQKWIFCARFMEFSKFEGSRNSGFKNR